MLHRPGHITYAQIKEQEALHILHISQVVAAETPAAWDVYEDV